MDEISFKIGTKNESFWTDLKKKSEETILSCKREIIIQNKVIELCEQMILEEQK